MEANEKTIVPQHAGTKRKGKMWCVIIVITLVVLGAVAGVIFTRQQEKYRQEMLETILTKISQEEFYEAEEIYCSLNEKTRQFVQNEVEQSLMTAWANWYNSRAESLQKIDSNTVFDDVRALKSLASTIGYQKLIPMLDKTLELEKFVPSAALRNE